MSAPITPWSEAMVSPIDRLGRAGGRSGKPVT